MGSGRSEVLGCALASQVPGRSGRFLGIPLPHPTPGSASRGKGDSFWVTPIPRQHSPSTVRWAPTFTASPPTPLALGAKGVAWWRRGRLGTVLPTPVQRSQNLNGQLVWMGKKGLTRRGDIEGLFLKGGFLKSCGTKTGKEGKKSTFSAT